MNRWQSVAGLTMLILLSVYLLAINPAAANPESIIPRLSMPQEYINYIIVDINGSLWAKIDGNYPIYLLKEENCSFGSLPMVYPIPPQTINITVWLNGRELGWINYTQGNPEATHHTAVGDWWMIYSDLDNVSDYFELEIHYEHPLEKVNGSYLFLYDLNVDPYLSELSNSSTAYFTIQMPKNVENLELYSTETDFKWNPLTFNLTETNSEQIASIQINSELGKPLLGDLIVEFSYDKKVDELPFLVATILLLTIAAAALALRRRNLKANNFKMVIS
jgi:hypothetical protein